MDRNTLYLWRKRKEDKEKGWASKDDFTCPMCGTPMLLCCNTSRLATSQRMGSAGCATWEPMREQRPIPSFTLGRISIWKLRKKEDKKTEMKNKKEKVIK